MQILPSALLRRPRPGSDGRNDSVLDRNRVDPVQVAVKPSASSDFEKKLYSEERHVDVLSLNTSSGGESAALRWKAPTGNSILRDRSADEGEIG